MKSKVVSAGLFASLSGIALAAVGFTVWQAVDRDAAATMTVSTAAGAASLQGAPGELRAPDFRKIRAAQERASAQPNDQRGLMPADDSRIFQRDNGSAGTDTYIVVLKDHPVASYDGGVKGLAATRPTAAAKSTSTFAMGGKRHGNRLDAKSETVRQYVSYLKARQGDFIAKAMGRGVTLTVQAQFQFAVNGMAARMTRDNAERLAGMAGVRRVYRARTMQLQTDAGPQMIGAPALWDNTIPSIEGNKGEGVVVGIIDTGINTDHPSFAAVGADGYEVQNPRGDGVFLGDCVATPALCNNKLIGVYTHPQITNSYQDWQFQSPPYTGPRPANGEDYNGHGSHTASTVAGNVLFDVPLLGAQGGNGDGFAAPYTFGRISGVAPHANIISYQACYPGGAGDLYAGCPEAPLLSAIDRAIADGVDVINYSIGGSEALPWDDAIELAFLNARAAGVFVAASAGNSGRQSRDHASPWLTVVAASSNARKIDSTPKNLNNFTGGDFPLTTDFEGKGISGAVTGPIVDAGSVPNPDANPWATNNGPYPPDLCAEPYPAGTFAPDTIVACKRGIVARTAKAQNVMAGGAGGMVLYNDPAVFNDQYYEEIADVMPIPAIHIMGFEGEELLNWLRAGSGHGATITASTVMRVEHANEYMADFSSRGPSATIRDTLFPSVSAPGIDVYAAFADEHPFSASPASADFASMSGTSMASPHVAGAAALLSRSHPDWTPAELQSALMTTTHQEVRSGEFDVTNASYYDFGAGRINVAAAANVGLVLNETVERYLAANVAEGGDVRGLNTPFMVNKACRNPCSWMRTFRATRDGTWNVDASIFKVYDVLSGQDIPENHIKFTVTPSTFTLRAGEKQTVIVTSDVRDFQTYFGNLSSHLFSGAIEFYGELKATPDDGTEGPTQHLPLILAYDSGDLPLSVDLNAHRNQGEDQVIDIQTKSITNLTLRTYGLVKPTITQVTLAAEITPNDFYDAFEFGVPNPTPGAGAGVFWTTVPEGAIQLNAEILDYFAGKFNNSGDVLVGIDLNNDGVPQPDELVCRSSAGAINNWCTLKRPRAGRYWTILRNYIDPFFPQEPVTFRFAQAVVLPTAAGNLTLLGPESNDGTQRFNLTMHWNVPGAQVGDVYYGAFDVGTDAANAGNIGFTSVRWERKRDDVVLDASQARAKAGDIIDFNLDVLENDTELARGYTLNATLPEGLSIVPGSVKPSAAIASQVVVDGRTIRLAGTQASTKRVPRTYAVTTNAASSSCKLREVTFDGYTTNAGGYIRMPIDYDTGIRGGQNEAGLVIPFRALFNDSSRHVPLFNRERNAGVIGIDAAGYVNLDGRMNWDRHFLLSEGSFNVPYEMIAPYWNSTLKADDALEGRVKFAYTRDEKHVFVEWENMATSTPGQTWWDPPVLNEDQDYNFEVQMSTELSFEPGESEFVFAYDRMEGPNDMGSIGLRGFTGPVDAFGPYNYPFLSAQVAYEDALLFPNGTQYPRVASAAVPGRMICLDYDGPERSRFNVRFQARVDESAAGATLDVVLQNGLAGADNVVVKKTIAVNGNVSIAGMSDMTTAEDVPVSGIPVYYVDNDGSANRISVSGEHVVATVHGNAAGSTFDLTPEKDWNGTTTVTVTVTDSVHTSDSVSTSFQLTVTPVADAPVAAVVSAALNGTSGTALTMDGSPSHDPDGDALSYQWTQLSGSAVTLSGATTAKATFTPAAAGSYSFRLTVSDGSASATQDVTVTVAAPPAPPAAPAPAPTPPSRGGGGSLDLWGLAALAAFLAWRSRPRGSRREGSARAN